MKVKGKRGPFASKITELREKSALGKNKVAGISDSYIQKIENQNFIPSRKIISKLATALKYNSPEQFEELEQLANQQRPIGERSSQLSPTKLAGVCEASIGTSRIDDYRELTLRAQRHIVIMGVGMTNLSKYAQESLRTIGSRVPIDFLIPPFLSS